MEIWECSLENMAIKKILVTGSEGYIGSIMMPILIKEGFEAVGIDTCFFSEGNLTKEKFPDYKLIKKDIRDMVIDDLRGFDAVIHLAALCNDPLGNIDENLTYEINHKASVKLAELAKKAGVRRFIFSSSCSLYGAGQDKILTENDESNPQTPYGKAKILVEQDLSKIADENFSPVFMRNATAMGISPRMRFDIVVNNLTGFAKTTSKIQILGDGTPWRPLVHVKDICNAFIAALKADKETIHNQAFNIGDKKENYQIKTIAEKVKENYYPQCEITIAKKDAGDKRDYRISFEKLNNRLKFNSSVTLKDCIIRLGKEYDKINLNDKIFNHPIYNRLSQIKKLIDEGKIDENFRWKK